MLSIALYRLVAELACIAGVVSAAVLAYADKSPWVWSWFLLFGFFNIITGGSAKMTEAVKTAEKKAAQT